MAKNGGRSSSPPSSSPPRKGLGSNSLSRSRRSRSRSRDSEDVSNPGNNLYVTGLSSRVTESDHEKYFSNEGKMAKNGGRSLSPPSSSPPRKGFGSNSLSRSWRSRSRSRDFEDVSNPGNNLYVTGLSSRVTQSDLEKYFSNEGKVNDCHLVTDPHSKESRGFGFVTMETNEGAERCLKYLNRSVLEGRLITVQKAKRSRGRTPTPGRYHGPTDRRGNDRNTRRPRSFSPRQRYGRGFDDRDGRRGRSPPPYGRRSPPPYGRRADDHSSHRRHRNRS